MVIGATLVSTLCVLAIAEPERLPWRHTLFLQFDGASLTWIPTPQDENAALNTSFLALFEGSEIPAYDGGDTDRQAVVAAVQNQFAGIGVRVVSERPPDHLPYTMAVVGGAWSDTAATSPVRGIAPQVDCARDNQRHVVFAFVSSDEPTIQQATTVSQEAAHAWGLDHVLGDGLIMSYDYTALDPEFADQCTPLCEEACQGPDTVFCEPVHEQFCPAGMQNSTAELLYTFGDDEPDRVAPTIAFVTPGEGALVPPGSDLVVQAEITDNYGGIGWRFSLAHNGRTVLDDPAFDRETSWPLTNLPQGEYVATLQALDHADHVTIATVTFEVGDPVGSTGAAEDDTGEDETGVPSTTTGDTAEAGDAQETGASETGQTAPGGDGEPGGCACTVRARNTPLGAWLGFFALALIRRTRR